MDCSVEYIEMCDCQEIQGQWEPRWGDWVVGNDGVVFPVSVGQLTQILSAREEEQIVWLPQAQVFDMLGKGWRELVGDLCLFQYGTYSQKVKRGYVASFHTREQLWLAFLMFDKHQLKWLNKKWVKK